MRIERANLLAREYPHKERCAGQGRPTETRPGYSALPRSPKFMQYIRPEPHRGRYSQKAFLALVWPGTETTGFVYA